VFNHLVPPDFWKARHKRDVWLSWQKTKADSDVYVQSNLRGPPWPSPCIGGTHSTPREAA
jgi:hypothetical protein